MKGAARIVGRTLVDAAAFGLAGAAGAWAVAATSGGRAPVVGVAVALAWVGGCAGLGGRVRGEPGLVAFAAGGLGAVAGLLNGVYADAIGQTGSLDAGLEQARAQAALLLSDRLLSALGAALPFAYAVHARASGWTLRQQLAEPVRVLWPLLAILWAILGLAWARGHTERGLGPGVLALVSLSLLALGCGPTLVYALADRLERRLLGPGEAPRGGHDAGP